MSYRYFLSGRFTQQPTVYRLFFGKKCYTWKGKNLVQSLETICKDIDRFVRNGVPADHLLKKVVDHINAEQILFCRVEVIKQTDNLTELIQFENLILKKCKEDPDCLNVKFEAHIPKWISEPSDLVKEVPTQNKARRDTIPPVEVSKHQPVDEIQPVVENKPSIGKTSIMDALAKLKKQQSAS